MLVKLGILAAFIGSLSMFVRESSMSLIAVFSSVFLSAFAGDPQDCKASTNNPSVKRDKKVLISF
jgi:hypothetical protein